MKIAWWNDRHNWLGKLVNLPLKKTFTLFLLLIIGMLIIPILNYQSSQHKLDDMNTNTQAQAENLAHQNKLFSILKKKTEHWQLTPELAARTLPINQYIQQISKDTLLINSSQWEFNQHLILELNVLSNFQHLSQFLTALLEHDKNIALIHLDIQQNHDDESYSIESHIILQLNQEKE